MKNVVYFEGRRETARGKYERIRKIMQSLLMFLWNIKPKKNRPLDVFHFSSGLTLFYTLHSETIFITIQTYRNNNKNQTLYCLCLYLKQLIKINRMQHWHSLVSVLLASIVSLILGRQVDLSASHS